MLKVSIITPSYNSEKFVLDTIKSILLQTYKDWELLIIDDCSKDSTIQVVEAFIKCYKNIRLIKLEKNSGPAIARNTGIKAAKGKYIAFLDSDDLWLPDKLENQVDFMEENNIDFSFHAYWMQNEGEKEKKIVKTRKKVSYNDLLKTCDIGCLTAMYNQEKLGKIYMPDIPKRQDYGLWLAILKKTQYAYSFEEPLAIYRLRKHSISRNKFKTMYFIWKVYRDVENLTFLQSIYYSINYIYYGIRRYS